MEIFCSQIYQKLWFL